MSYYHFYNPNPRGCRVADCVKRCLTKATGMDYMEVQRELNRIKRELGVKDYTHKSVYQTFVKVRGYKKISFPAERGESRMTVSKLAEAQAFGDYEGYNIICNCAHHLVCVSNGEYWDTWDSGDKCVYNAYLVPNSDVTAKKLQDTQERKKQLSELIKQKTLEKTKLTREINKLKEELETLL